MKGASNKDEIESKTNKMIWNETNRGILEGVFERSKWEWQWYVREYNLKGVLNVSVQVNIEEMKLINAVWKMARL